MSPTLRIGTALSDGIDRLTTRGGLTLAAILAVLQVITQVGFNSLFADLLADAPPAGSGANAYPLALPVPVAASALITGLALLGTFLVTIVAMRAVYADINEVPNEQHTRRLGRTAAVLLVLSVIVTVAITVGFALLFVPGLFLAVSLAFAQLAVVIEDAGVVEALKRSWSLTSGSRIRLFVLGLIVVVIAGVAGGVFGLLSAVSPTAGNIASAAVTGVTSLFTLTVLVSAYRQLAEPDTAGSPQVSELAD